MVSEEMPSGEGGPGVGLGPGTVTVFTLQLRVRQYEADALGHVNNAVYLNYAEEAAIEHARALGFDEARWRALGGTWVVRRHEIEYRAPALPGEDLHVTTRIVSLDRSRGKRETTISRAADGRVLARALTEWIWVGMDGRPRRLPAEVVATFSDSGEKSGRATP